MSGASLSSHDHDQHHHDHTHHGGHDHRGAGFEVDAAFVVTINPEARVEVQRTKKTIGPLIPGEWTDIAVLIANEGYVTGPLQILVNPVDGVDVEAPLTELTRDPIQEAVFRVRFAEVGAADLTMRFWALGALGGLANKNTSHLYLTCRDHGYSPSEENRTYAARSQADAVSPRHAHHGGGGTSTISGVTGKACAVVIAAAAVAHLWIAVVGDHGPWMSIAMIVMALWCFSCARDVWRTVRPETPQRVIAASLIIVAVHTVLLLSPPSTGHAHRVELTPRRSSIDLSHLLVIGFEVTAALTLALVLRRLRSVEPRTVER